MTDQAKCKRCGEPFEPKIYRIEHCELCFKEMLEKFANAPVDQIIKSAGKAIFED